MNRYVVAAAVAAALGALYGVLALKVGAKINLDEVLTVLLNAFVCVVTFALFITLKGERLGELKHEHGSIALALFFSVTFSLYTIGERFVNLYKDRGTEAVLLDPKEMAWLYGRWGANGDCRVLLTIDPAASSSEILITTDSRTYPRRIVGRATKDSVSTAEGTFKLEADGSMASTEQGLDSFRWERCSR